MKLMKKLIALALVAISVVAVALPAMAATTNYVKVQGPGYTVNVRDANGTKIGAITHGSAVYVLGSSGTKKQIRCHDYATDISYGNNSAAYIESKFLSSSIPTNAAWISRYGTVNHKLTNSWKAGCAELQQDLNRTVASALKADGICGTQTVNAIKSFQSVFGLTQDGIAGNRTKEYLYKVLYMN